MSLEIIRRKEGELSQKQGIRHEKTQISYNDFGHICIREFDTERQESECGIGVENCDKESRLCYDYSIVEQCKNHKFVRTDDEHLIVLDQKTSRQLINFVVKLFRQDSNGLPF